MQQGGMCRTLGRRAAKDRHPHGDVEQNAGVKRRLYSRRMTPMIEIFKYTATGSCLFGCLVAVEHGRRTCCAACHQSRTRSNSTIASQLHNTGNSRGYGMIPIFVGSVADGARSPSVIGTRVQYLFHYLSGRPDQFRRLRFFITSEHTADEIVGTVQAVKEELGKFW